MLNSSLGIMCVCVRVCVQSLSLNDFPRVDILLIVRATALLQCKLGNSGCVGKLNTLSDGSRLFYVS